MLAHTLLMNLRLIKRHFMSSPAHIFRHTNYIDGSHVSLKSVYFLCQKTKVELSKCFLTILVPIDVSYAYLKICCSTSRHMVGYLFLVLCCKHSGKERVKQHVLYGLVSLHIGRKYVGIYFIPYEMSMLVACQSVACAQ